MINRHIKYILLGLCLFLFPLKGEAATLNLNGKSSTNVGSNYELILDIADITDETGIAGIGGSIDYDHEYLEIMSYQSLGVFGIAYSKSSSIFSGF